MSGGSGREMFYFLWPEPEELPLEGDELLPLERLGEEELLLLLREGE
jgi:hypothetical protein